ncbi:hypothetical protein MUY27_04515 [Mucilaginibacter sp. RS28]|uniref:Uncharacterized protein n=1 Tax=Mucilaginibacter straminoryzae TaxID=2932774 RepID=A0A9X1X2U6_9SPHI|nr:hypothetical protein [Mucilaginibacter straminoryzae]MCJ8208960.1 hypothetical protein [Mucilaginibacter straminoryzae]
MKAKSALGTLTAYLVVYTALFQYQGPALLLGIMFLLSPVLLVLTIYLVLKDDSSAYPELNSGEEWGYADKPKKDLGIF